MLEPKNINKKALQQALVRKPGSEKLTAKEQLMNFSMSC